MKRKMRFVCIIILGIALFVSVCFLINAWATNSEGKQRSEAEKENEWDGDMPVTSLENLKNLPNGYTDEEIVNVINMCQTGVDQEFVKLMAQGNYEEAFTIHPDELSLEMGSFLADYAVHLIDCDQNGNYEMEAFEKYNNALLSSTTDASRINWKKVAYERRQYKDIYLDMMMQGSEQQLKEEAIRLSEMDPYAEDYDTSYYSACFKLHSILSTEDIIIGELHKRGKDRQCKIWELQVDGCDATKFSIVYYSRWNREQMQVNVSVSQWYEGDINLLHSLQRLNVAKKGREVMYDDYDELMEWIGSGAVYSMEGKGVIKKSDNNVAFLGVYNPDTLRAINSWNRYGVASWPQVPRES